MHTRAAAYRLQARTQARPITSLVDPHHLLAIEIEAALGWLDAYGDVDGDGDGFIEYERHTTTGLVNQGWKDSDDSISHADGRLAEGAIALVEVQAYVYLARLSAARIAIELGHEVQAQVLRDQAEDLRRRFEERFWCDELGTYVLALDGEKRPCRCARPTPYMRCSQASPPPSVRAASPIR